MNNWQHDGFTLIEVLMVIFIMGLLVSGVSLPGGILARTELLAVRDRLAMDLRWARMRAIMDNKKYYFRIYSRDEDGDGECKYEFYNRDQSGVDQIVRQGNYPASYQLYKNTSPVAVAGSSYDRIRFTGIGTALNGTIGLENDEGKMIMITVSQLGRVREYEQ